jgi:hypothetical protein
MSDDANSTNNGEQFANEQDEQQGEHWLTVKEAAAHLGIGVRAVQQRIARGKVRHKREGDRLLVCLESVTVVSLLPDEHSEHDEQTDANNEQDTNSVFANNEHFQRSQEVFQTNKELFDQLRSENTFLRAELTAQRTAADVEKSELRRLMLADKRELSELRDQVKMLNGERVSPTRLAAPPVESAIQDAQETRTAQVETNTVNPPLAAGMGAQGPQEPRRAWWRFWRR